MKKFIILLGVISLALIMNGCGARKIVIVKRPESPPPKVIVKVKPPRKACAWVPGYWQWRGKHMGYVWVSGYWK